MSDNRSNSAIYSRIKLKWLGDRSKASKYAKNAQEAPIFRLPTEVLIEIFAVAVQNDDLREKPPSNLRICDVLSRTCSHFRVILLNMPDAWTVDVAIDWSPSALSKYLETMLQRVKNSPLRVVVRDGRHSVKAELLSAFASALRNAKVENIASLSFFLGRSDMIYFPKLFMDLLPAAPRSLTIHALPSPPARGVFKRTKGPFLKAFFIPAGPIVTAIESIQVIDALLGIGFDEQDESPMALRSLKVIQSGDKAPRRLSCGLLSNAFLVRCDHLEIFVFHGRFLQQHPAVGRPRVAPLREIYLAKFESDNILRFLSTEMSFPNLTTFGADMYRANVLYIFITLSPSISELSIPSIDPGMAFPFPQITKLTITSNGLSSLSTLPERDICAFTGLGELVIDCRQQDVSREDLETLIQTRVVHATANGYERPLSAISLWKPDKFERITLPTC